MLILGFGNKARQGKDTAAAAIWQYYEDQNARMRLHGMKGGPKVGIYKFATALYEEVNEALSVTIGNKDLWERRYIEDHIPAVAVSMAMPRAVAVRLPDWVQPDPNPEISDLAPYGKHPKLLQWWGTEFRRAQDPDYWTKKLFQSIPSNLDLALITDVRFPNELDGIKQRGGYNINVQRLTEYGTPYYADDRPVDHPSETALDYWHYWDFRITNPHGHQALFGEVAITHAVYLWSLGPSK
jgi:hypothetical protein